MVEERLKINATRFAQGGRGALVDPGPGVDKSTKQPGPDGSLMIAPVPLVDAALVARRVAGLAGGERPQPQGRPEPVLDCFDDEEGAVVLDQSQRQAAHRKNLVWAEGAIDRARLVIHIDHVEEHSAFGIPETTVEGREAPLERLLPAVVVLA